MIRGPRRNTRVERRIMCSEEVISVNGLIHYKRATNKKVDELTKLPRVVSCSNVIPAFLYPSGESLWPVFWKASTCNPKDKHCWDPCPLKKLVTYAT
jgi:hypothetical protein